ncbi:LysR family transcriptional regulator [Paenibacillus xylanexedens]|uniref:LysR family transcriptional regulator n=1 Tax=Paenibacillus xylanexedens TaxID=528191 RepID=UPI0011A82790|nr:LysR family transcriptional regulator [Paenibacillus xylanexedens]
MNIDQIKYVLEVEKTQSITIASQNLLVTPSAISQSISKMEEELNLKLFNRNRLGMFPLDENHSIFEKLRLIVETEKNIKLEASNIGAVLKGHIHLSVIPGGLLSVIKTIATVKEIHPKIKIEVSEKTTSKIIQDIRHNDADLGLIAIYKHQTATELTNLNFIPITEGKLVLCVRSDNPLAQKSFVSVEDLQDQTFVFFNDEYTDEFIASLQACSAEVNVLFRTNNSESISTALQSLEVVTIGHEYSFKYLAGLHPSKYKLLHFDMVQSPIQIGWISKSDHKSNVLLETFLNYF